MNTRDPRPTDERSGSGRAPAGTSPVALFAPLLLAVGASELVLMWFLERFTMPRPLEAIVDASALTLLVAPVLWWLLGRPLRRAHARLERAREQLEEMALERRELLAMLDESTLIAVTDGAGRITQVNDNFCRATGWSRDELLGNDHRVLDAGRHPREFWRDMFEVTASGRPWHGEVCCRTRQGTEIWTDTIISASPGLDGRPGRYLSLRVDITERKRAEETMRMLVEAGSAGTSQEFLAGVVRSLAETLHTRHALIGELDPDRPGHVRSVAVWSDGRAGEPFGYAPAGMPCGTAMDAREPCLVLEGAQERYAGGSLLAIFGAQCYVGAPLLDVTGRVVGVIAAMDDRPRPELSGCGSLLTLYSERVAAELRRMRLERQVQRLSRAVESAADAVVITDPAGRIDYVNPAFTRVTGYEPSEVLGRNMRLLKSGLQPDDYYRHMWRTLLAGQTWYGRVVNRRKDGSNYHAALNVSPLLDELGQVSGYVGVQRDVTHLVEHERELLEARAAAEAASRAKSEFLANMSHEIRTPMNGVLGMTQLLLDTSLQPEQREYALTVRRSGEALLAILNDILDFSKIEAGKLAMESVPFAWNEAIEEVVELLSAKAEEKGLVLAVGWDPRLPSSVIGDPGRLRQILMNLAGNAVKFTERGHVAIHVGADSIGSERVRLRVTVRDTGIGLSEEQCARLFERFEQADNSNTRRFGGTGLGLAISKQLAELMGGTVGCTGVPGEGSTFWFTLDLEIADPTPVVAGLGGALAGAHVLVAHRDAAQRAALATLLAACGADVMEAGDAASAAAAVAGANGALHLVVLDLEFAARWRERGAPVLLLAPAVARTRMAEFEDAGFAGCLLEPVRPGALLRAADQLAGHARSATKWGFVTRRSLADVPASRPAPGGAVARALLGARVLVVEDNLVNQRVAVGLLKRMSCTAEVASDGREGLRRCMEDDFDAVLMDCQMPVMDGYEATRLIREHEAAAGKPRRPILALTASALEGDRERCIAAGMDDFLTKPVKADDLRAALERWLRARDERAAA